MDNKVTIIMRIIFQYALSILIFYVAKIFFPVISKVVILYYIIALLIIILLHLNNIVVIFKKRQQKTIKLFNIYYINYQKVFEICMLINNERVDKEELTYRDEYSNGYTIGANVSINKKMGNILPSVSRENSNTKTYEYKELQEIKNTNSTYLNEIINVCKDQDNKDLKNGDLVKIDNVKLKIINKTEIAQINSMLAGVFNGNKITTDSDGQIFNIDINAISNILLKDYKYNLKGTTDNLKNFYISIPVKAEKEFENDYSIYDLEIGEVNIIGIYRTDKYKYDDTSTFNYLQKLGSEDIPTNIMGDELFKSNTTIEKNDKDLSKKEGYYTYVDLIAIVQDLNIKGGNVNE